MKSEIVYICMYEIVLSVVLYVVYVYIYEM